MKAAYDPRTMAMIRERGIVLEICPTSNLNTGVVSGWDEFRWIFDQFHRNGVRYTISTDGPEMLKTYIRDELATLGRLGILSLAEQEQIAATSLAASFVPNVSDVASPVLRARAAQGRGARGGLSRPRPAGARTPALRPSEPPRPGTRSSGRRPRCAARGPGPRRAPRGTARAPSDTPRACRGPRPGRRSCAPAGECRRRRSRASET